MLKVYRTPRTATYVFCRTFGSMVEVIGTASLTPPKGGLRSSGRSSFRLRNVLSPSVERPGGRVLGCRNVLSWMDKRPLAGRVGLAVLGCP